MNIFSLVMVVTYIGVGIYLLVSPKFVQIQKEVKVIFAVFFMLYGIFRLARTWPKLRNYKH
ncbi:MAG: hypothetical protein WCM76_12265 [Bacteroidota bacterium]